MSSAGFMASFFGGGRASSAASQEAALPFPDVAPSWESLAASLEAACLAAGVEHSPDLVNGPTNPHSLQRLFGSTAPPRVHLYRDTAAWCPYCEKVWLQLEEKRIPYTVEKINMRCYGDKPASFLAICPSGMLPALELDGELYTESAAIAQLLEDKFPGHAALLPAPGTVERRAADELLRLERALFSRWMQWLTRSGDSGKPGFLEALGMVEQALQRSGGPYFLGPQLSLVDITFAPFLERMAASLLYYKAFRMRGVGAYPGLEAWFTAMHGRPTFNAIQSDVYTHAHDLPPQLGGCEFNALGPAVAAALDGHDSSSWRLPLGPLSDTSLEAWPGGDSPEKDRLEACLRLVKNHGPVTRFAARGCGTPGRRPVSAPLSDPTAQPGETHLPDVDAALRLVAHALLTGHAADGTPLPSVLAAHGAGAQPRCNGAAAAAAAEYLRDRVGVPRDMRYPAARQLRAHLNWFVDGVQPAAR